MTTTSSIPVTIGTTVIQFPATGQSPIWSEAIIQFVQAVELQLQLTQNPFDISSTVQILTSNTNNNINLNGNGANLSFPTGSVRSFVFNYGIYRLTTTESVIDTGIVNGIYSIDTATWFIQHEFDGDVQTDGTPYHTFDINGSNELVLTTVALSSGVYNNINSTISYSVQTQLVMN